MTCNTTHTRTRGLKTAAMILLTGTLLGGALTACNTFEGAGQDVQAGGRAIERSADNVQKKL
ncbi:entericidin, EcnA/B family [Azospirillum cavernae]|uniref:Entericidin, EcnA/B family n=1 Tax=Azospirillum cavernae TaxID=2320860 RepID=A0A418W3N8_9PROT|nr:entericidin A/B family lipoprotein [Azospirillum cavernae]RJF84631.1 entericidin, EcnA/B family [Azospirillum cavernae]